MSSLLKSFKNTEYYVLQVFLYTAVSAKKKRERERSAMVEGD
jgi:hypothetical protein